MSPYLSFGLAMCAVVLLSLFATAYLAMVFNKRAKRDTVIVMTPLAEMLEGELDLEESSVTGRFGGHIAEAKMANAPKGAGRLFQTQVVDAAGGTGWIWTSRERREQDAEVKFESSDPELETSLLPAMQEWLDIVRPGALWAMVEYMPESGFLRLTRPIRGRKEIPTVDQLTTDLNALVEIVRVNRLIQSRDDV